jgi:hypothetical protein
MKLVPDIFCCSLFFTSFAEIISHYIIAAALENGVNSIVILPLDYPLVCRKHLPIFSIILFSHLVGYYGKTLKTLMMIESQTMLQLLRLYLILSSFFIKVEILMAPSKFN